ncbi:cytochrome c3 family protein [Limnochorda pilosa]|uniref:Cytochrome c7-like domain-containing protein n=1 Tax=Limnochorda pilosa TaxID=1555112 RepID=A0A0K2SKD3_LIMPI|nr:cytochrome c3 family protein [Limnochorda pilosa]BAS27294.1 hypothetical protein LIP_1445 [Limnochorda pilosa]
MTSLARRGLRRGGLLAVLVFVLLVVAAVAQAGPKQELANSAHSTPVESAATRAACATCHDGPTFAGERPEGVTITDPKGLSCTDCHDWSGSQAPEGLRVYGEAKLPNGLVLQNGSAALCVTCHNGRRDTGDPKTAQGLSAPHRSPQGEMLAGTGAFEFPGYRYTNSVHTTLEEGCVACHMAPGPAEGEAPFERIGGHTFTMAYEGTENLNACTDCHPLATSFNRPATADWDGDRRLEGVQDEVHGLVELVKGAIEAALDGGRGGVIHESHGAVEFLKKDGQTKLEGVPESIYKATYNLLFVENDGSLGIHNTAYAVQLLQSSYQAVTGHPVPDAAIR